jgi:hypothetical protein
MQGSSGAESSGFQPTGVFRRALAEALAQEQAGRTRRAERAAAIAAVSSTDLASLVEQFDALLQGPGDAVELVARLHAALRALSADALLDGEDDDA